MTTIPHATRQTTIAVLAALAATAGCHKAKQPATAPHGTAAVTGPSVASSQASSRAPALLDVLARAGITLPRAGGDDVPPLVERTEAGAVSWRAHVLLVSPRAVVHDGHLVLGLPCANLGEDEACTLPARANRARLRELHDEAGPLWVAADASLPAALLHQVVEPICDERPCRLLVERPGAASLAAVPVRVPTAAERMIAAALRPVSPPKNHPDVKKAAKWRLPPHAPPRTAVVRRDDIPVARLQATAPPDEIATVPGARVADLARALAAWRTAHPGASARPPRWQSWRVEAKSSP